jgi:hypothetical protein
MLLRRYQHRHKHFLACETMAFETAIYAASLLNQPLRKVEDVGFVTHKFVW